MIHVIIFYISFLSSCPSVATKTCCVVPGSWDLVSLIYPVCQLCSFLASPLCLSYLGNLGLIHTQEASGCR